MEKLVCALWAPEGESPAALGERLKAQLPAALKEAGARGIRLNLCDAAVEPAAVRNLKWQPVQQQAVAQFWLPSANARFRGGIDRLLAAQGARFEAWLVAESTIIPNTRHAPVAGERTWGWAQSSFISFRPDMAWKDAVNHWHSHHTRIAIETQANFEYVQNIIVRPLTEGAPAYDAFVEECFSPAAMTDLHDFFDAIGDEARFAHNTTEMRLSCDGFIDSTRIDIIPTSQFDFAHLDNA